MNIAFINNLLGVGNEHLTFFHLIFRSMLVYIICLLLMRLNRRFIAIRTTSNFFLYVFIGSILATAIVEPLFYEILGMVIFLMLFNWLIAVLENYFPFLKIFIEGKQIILIDNGKVNKDELKKYFISERELSRLLRIKTNTADLSNVEKSYLENSGQISFILK